ncbi:MAG: ABC transporter permease subunit, partial [Alphaproteobacteria bacterium]|nr:ABC transporter permease subunit [Alphaproteobacteria bacterium]
MLRFTAAEWRSFALILGVAALYISVFFALGLLISTLTHRSTTSLVFSFLIWVLLVLVIPNTAPIVSRALAPVPSSGVIAGQREAIHRQIWDELHRGPRGSREEHRQAHDTARERISEETGKVLSAYLQKVDAQVSL